MTGTGAILGRPTRLTDRECDLLSALAASGGPLDREAIRAALRIPEGAGSGAVDGAIRRLRAKIGPHALLSVFGRGWRLVTVEAGHSAPPSPPEPLFGRERELAALRSAPKTTAGDGVYRDRTTPDPARGGRATSGPEVLDVARLVGVRGAAGGG